VVAGRFAIEQELGAGGIGTVYLARDVENGARVVLKRVRDLGEAFSRFAREAQSLARFQHPHVVRYIAHGLDDTGTPYLVMEWLEGEDLRARLRRQPLTIHETWTLASCVADTLAAVHARGLLHRDIKPGNLFLVDRHVDKVKLLDFGLVRSDIEAMSITRTGAMIGTPGYMAPEQARGQKDIDARADLFSLGCVLYKCLSGRAPFEGSNIVAVMTKVLVSEPPRLRDLRPEIPPALADLVHRLLAKLPQDRPQTADEVSAALAAMALEDSDDSPAPPSRRGGLSARERRLSVLLLVSPVRDRTIARPKFESVLPSLELTNGRAIELEGKVLDLFLMEHGGNADRLVDGTLVITPVDAGSATDQAVWAARCALSLQAILPIPMAIAMGHRESTSGSFSDPIERAASMLGEGLAAAEITAEHGRPAPAWVAIDSTTLALLDSRFEVQQSGDTALLTGLRDAPLGTRSLLGRTIPMVGRDWELSTLAALFRESLDTPCASAALVTGAAGTGKTRLAQEVVARIKSEHPDAAVWAARGASLRASSPYHVLGRLVWSALDLGKEETDDARRNALLDAAAARLPFESAEEVAAILGEIAGVSFPDRGGPSLRAAWTNTGMLALQVRRAWEAFVVAECTARPLVIVLDDLQWADVPSVRQLDAALQACRSLPFLLLLLGRPEVHGLFPALSKGVDLHEIRLKPLSARASAEMIGKALGDEASPEVRAALAARGDGNAFFLEELIRAWLERGPGAVAGDGGVPSTVLATVQARISRLDDGTRRILRAASVFGDVFWASGVASLLGEPDARALDKALDGLVAQDIVVRHRASRFVGEQEFAFRHSVLREAAGAMLTDEDRSLGHGLAANWLEARGEQDPEVLARHREMSRRGGRARGSKSESARESGRGGKREERGDGGEREREERGDGGDEGKGGSDDEATVKS
jgi:serine/threonine protein kinase